MMLTENFTADDMLACMFKQIPACIFNRQCTQPTHVRWKRSHYCSTGFEWLPMSFVYYWKRKCLNIQRVQIELRQRAGKTRLFQDWGRVIMYLHYIILTANRIKVLNYEITPTSNTIIMWRKYTYLLRAYRKTRLIFPNRIVLIFLLKLST